MSQYWTSCFLEYEIFNVFLFYHAEAYADIYVISKEGFMVQEPVLLLLVKGQSESTLSSQ